jgi:hypothetical protein
VRKGWARWPLIEAGGGRGGGSALPHGKKKGGVRQARCGGEGWGPAPARRAQVRRAAGGVALSLEPEIGEVHGEADGWARGHCVGRRRFYSDSNQVQTNSKI